MKNIIYKDAISFNNTSYPVISLDIRGFGYETIAPESLQEKLLDDGKYVSDEAMRVDEQIFFYVKNPLFDRYSPDELKNYVEKNVA